MVEVDEYAGGGALVALGEVLGEVFEEFVFVSDLLGKVGVSCALLKLVLGWWLGGDGGVL